jgi:hypothetical protein
MRAALSECGPTVFNMRAADMEVGRTYALESDRPSGPAQVKLLAKEHPRPGEAQVEFLNGIPKGRRVSVSTRRILHEWGKDKPKPRPRQTKKPQPPPLAVGGTVEWEETGPILWKVTKLDEEQGVARLRGEIFGRSTEREAPIDALQAVGDEPDPERDRQAREAVESAIGETEVPEEDSGRTVRSQEDIEPELPDDAKQRLIEQLVLSPEVLAKYRKRFAPKKRRGPVEEQMRRELRRRGKLYRLKPWSRRRKKNEYIRVRVPGRYEIIVPESPSSQEATGYVTEIVGLGRRRERRGKPKTGSGQAKRRRGSAPMGESQSGRASRRRRRGRQ